MLADYLVTHDGELPEGEQLTALRDKLYPDRTTSSVYMQARDIQAALGYSDRHINYSAQIRAVARLFINHPVDMANLARDIELLRQRRHSRPVLPQRETA